MSDGRKSVIEWTGKSASGSTNVSAIPVLATVSAQAAPLQVPPTASSGTPSMGTASGSTNVSAIPAFQPRDGTTPPKAEPLKGGKRAREDDEVEAESHSPPKKRRGNGNDGENI